MVIALAGLLCAPCAFGAKGRGGHPLVWGMDLGNHNSVTALASRDGVDVVTNDVSGRQMPSAVYFAEDHRLVGEHSAGHAGSNPRNLVNNLKQLLEAEEQALAEHAFPSTPDFGNVGKTPIKGPYKGGKHEERQSAKSPTTNMSLDPDDLQRGAKPGTVGTWTGGNLHLGGDFTCRTRPPVLDLNGKGQSPRLKVLVSYLEKEMELSVNEVLSSLLEHANEVVEREGCGETSSLVVSVPSYFTLRQQRAIIDAAAIADLPVHRVMDEGTAVALCYGILKGAPLQAGEAGGGGKAGPPAAVVAFVDIGHSCTQVTVASFDDTGLTVLGRGCARGRGTSAVEGVVFQRLCSLFKDQGVDVKGSTRALFRLGKAVSAAVKTLSANTEAFVSVDCIDGENDVSATLRRAEVEELCTSISVGVATACKDALRNAGVGPKDVVEAELLGGGSYIPALRQAVESVFGDKVRRTMSSSESVARGCALGAAQHSALIKLRPFRVTDSLARPLKLIWRYRPRSEGATGVAIEEPCGPGCSGEVSVGQGTRLPSTTSIEVPVGDFAGYWGEDGWGGGTLHLHVMEGVDRVSSYKIVLPQPQTQKDVVGLDTGGGACHQQGSAAAAAGSGAGAGGLREARLKFVLRVDDGGVPEVGTAR
ncbi:unnamed protein product [Discosporangium mesarthrocarpum]